MIYIFICLCILAASVIACTSGLVAKNDAEQLYDELEHYINHKTPKQNDKRPNED